MVEEIHRDNDNDDSTEENGEMKEVKSDHLREMIWSVKPTPSLNLHKFISVLLSIPCSNASVESVS